MSKSPSLRRIQADIRELSLDPSDQYYAAPLESDMHEWHFTIRGAADTDFAGGIYHGRILLPPEYPFKPPHIVFLTPSGRFETHTKICLSFSAFHPELWQPAWGIRLILEALIAFLPSPADGAIGALDWSPAERKRLATKSQDFCCPLCGKVANLLPALRQDTGSRKPSRFQKEIEQLQRMQSQEHQKKDDDDEVEKGDESETNEECNPPSSAETPVARAEETTKGNASANSPKEAITPVLSPTTPNVVETNVLVSESSEIPPVASPAPAAEPVPPPPLEPVGPRPAVRLVVADNGNNDDEAKPSWLVEPALQMAILVLSVVCFLLIRKIQALCAELQALEQ